jgi:nitrogenase molybdenum-iron protein NifN
MARKIIDEEERPLPGVTSATTNACKLCTPLGACLAFHGVEGVMPFLHGSQGCSTYIRRYLISHYNEPMDIASSNFSEASTIFGGGSNLTTGLLHVTEKYHPTLIGIATTCLAETIGDDVAGILDQYRHEQKMPDAPHLVQVSTPSYRGTHVDGFHLAVRALVQALAHGGPRQRHLNLFPGMVSPADLRYLKEIITDFGLPFTMLPDYADTLDAPIAKDSDCLPTGGTPLMALMNMGRSRASIEFGRTHNRTETAGKYLREQFRVPWHRLGLPIGIRETDRFFNTLKKISDRPVPRRYDMERGRLIDAMVDGHKYLSGLRVVVYGDEDLVIGLVSFLTEIGAVPVVCASGGESGHFARCLHLVAGERCADTVILEGADFIAIEAEARRQGADLMIGHSKGQSMARRLGIPLVRVGFPIHDRLGGQRLLHIGYRGALALFDTIVNTMIARTQDSSPVGYSYM